MIIISTIEEIRTISQANKSANKQIGFIPTMGALHNGHLSLIKHSNAECDITICSIFVNPEQFNNSQDLSNYPITKEKDIELLEEAGCDVLFYPDKDAIYVQKPILRFHFGHLETTMEGAFRPGHFSGVALVVSKLLHYVSPHKAYFGEKDFQQLAIIKQMVTDLSFNVEVVSCPTIRNEQGLALSSRNQLLSGDDKKEAEKIYKALTTAREQLKSESITQVKDAAIDYFNGTELQLEYFEIVNSQTLEPISEYSSNIRTTICVAAYLGNVRLIDNLTV